MRVMKNFTLKLSVLWLHIIMTTVGASKLPKREGCPESIDVRPCTCYSSPATTLVCQNIDDSDILRSVFLNSERYTFKEVHIEYSTLQYLPYGMFEKMPVKSLHLKNSTLVQLFNKPPEFLEALDTLHIENSKLLRGVVWKILEPLAHLRILNIYFNKIKTLGEDFKTYTTKELQQITFHGTETTLIKPGTFVEFTKLSKIAMDNCKLTELTRDIFPVPFNVQILHFNQNKLTTIPDDLFSNMPNLQTVGLKHNQISVIPDSSLEGSLSKLQFLLLEGNPMICDCRLAWLIKEKPEAVSGECHFPSKLKGKHIKDVESDYLKC